MRSERYTANPMLTREEFKEEVFKRDGYLCINCSKEAVDAHHITERKLWEDGGYYLDNGSSLCSDCHWKAESTELSVRQILESCGIQNYILPSCLEAGYNYDKWGNRILDGNVRQIGPLFEDGQVQKILYSQIYKGKIKFIMGDHLYKYPRTYHVPWSLGSSSDDKFIPSMDIFEGIEVVVTEKMDGENTSLYNDYLHARSLNTRYHVSRDWVKLFHANMQFNIPEGWRICGENMFAKHSIAYEDLPSYFLGFSIWNENNLCLGWDETLDFFELLDVSPVKEVWRGIYDEKTIKEFTLEQNKINSDSIEGFVIRKADSFHYNDFKNSLVKFVRENHVQTDQHWTKQKITPNTLKDGLRGY